MEGVSSRELSRKEQFQQIDRASSLKNVKKSELKQMLDNIQGLDGEVAKTSEQELFSALISQGLGKIDKNLQAKFLEKLPGLVAKVKTFDPLNTLLRGTRRALKQLVDEKLLDRGAGRILRKFALGNAQLDKDRTRLSANQKAIAFSKIFDRVAKNRISTDAELIKFNKNNMAELPKEVKTEAPTVVVPNPVTPSTPIPVPSEFDLRKEQAQQILNIIVNPVSGMNELDRLNRITKFYVSERDSTDETTRAKADLVLKRIAASNAENEASVIAAYNSMSEYMKSVFNLDLPPLTTNNEEK